MGSSPMILLVTWLALCASLGFLSGEAEARGIAFVRASSSHNFGAVLSFRGGASTAVDSDDEAIQLDEDESSDDEEQDAVTSKLSASALKATAKVRAQKTSTAKNVMNEKLTTASVEKTTSKKKKSSFGLKLPYFIRACLNPFTVIKMTKAYFASLCNLDYLENQTKDSSRDLRSALEEKAKKSGGGPKGRRKMKPGQAKTLSDLPQLNT